MRRRLRHGHAPMSSARARVPHVRRAPSLPLFPGCLVFVWRPSHPAYPSQTARASLDSS
ncbi:hypothetical protein ACRRTK_016001 [Alexandromys fortis]